MKTLFGAVAGAVAVIAVLGAYDLGARQALNPLNPDAAAMAAAYQQGQAYLVQASQGGYLSPYSQYAAPVPAQYVAAAPMPRYAAPQYVNERVIAQPAVQRVSTTRTVVAEPAAKPARSWQKSALLIGGSAAGGAGVGALMGGKKGAGIGALIGGGSAAIYDQIKRH